MKVVSYFFEDLDREMWTILENRARYLNVFQTYGWANVLKSIGTEPQFLILLDKGDPLVGLLMFKSRLMSRISAYEAMSGPLIVSMDESVSTFFARELKNRMKAESALYFYWSPSPYLNWEPYLLNQGFLQVPMATFLIDLRPSTETLWGNLEGRARRAVKKAERSEVNVVEVESWSDWKKFFTLYVNEGGLPPYSINLHRSIHKFLLPQERAKLLVAKHHGKMIAGIVFLQTNYEIVGYRGISDIRYMKFCPNSAIHWHTICSAKELGLKYYDMGGALWNPDKRDSSYGVHMFKRQWGGKLHRYYGFALNRLYVIGRNLFFNSSRIRQLYNALEELRIIRRTDRL